MSGFVASVTPCSTSSLRILPTMPQGSLPKSSRSNCNRRAPGLSDWARGCFKKSRSSPIAAERERRPIERRQPSCLVVLGRSGRTLRLADLQIADEAFEPASVAILAQFYVDQVPATTRVISGTETPRILGRLTPGSPIVWQRLVREIAQHQPAMMSLRNAI